MTGKRLGLRTDALNVFEKDILPDTAHHATALIVEELQKVSPNLTLDAYFDSYEQKQPVITQEYDLDFYNKLIGAKYDSDFVETILKNLGVKKS
jgi:phenylalanyl-tRNA synthetase beta subunit